MNGLRRGALLIAVFAIGGCAFTGSGPRQAPAAGPIDVRLTPYPFNSDVHGNDLPVEIGRFDVPAVREQADTERLFELGFVRYPAEEGARGLPIVFLSRETRPSTQRQELYASLRSLGEVVIFNRRGYGFSSPPAPCPGRINYPFGEPLRRPGIEPALRDYAAECFAAIEQSGMPAAAYAPAEIPDDVADLARALETERIVLVAEGPMAALAVAAMRLHPGLVARTILVNPETGADGGVEAVLEALDSGRVPDSLPVLATVRSIRQALEQAPWRLTATSRSGREVPLTVGPLDFELMLAGAVYGPRPAWGDLLPAIASARAGDTSLMAGLALELRSRIGQPDPIALIDTAFPVGAASSDTEFARYWPGVGLPDARDPSAGVMGETIPGAALVIAGTLHPYGSAAGQGYLVESFESGTFLIVRNGTRDVLEETPELASLLRRFIAGEEIATETLTATGSALR